ncbi:MAG TPA: PKD domain-containing protein [Vicinamibacterales bacterium]|nr:PKD domain-containing protein [Vicinamibacterales bacterium]
MPGDTLLLRAGETFHGNFTLPAKSGTSWITIRSDASDSQLPADGVRLVPSDRSGGNTSRSLLPRLVGLGGALITTPVVETKPGAHNYRLEFLEIDGSANLGFETLVQLGDGSAATPPSDIILDRDYLHGHPTKGMKRGVSLNGVRCDVINSYIADIKAVNADSQGIAGWNGAGPFKIINNYIEAGAENILFGGSDPGVANLIPSDITVSRNYLTRPIAWRNPIMATPASVSASATTGGSLTAGAHYFRVVAVLYTDSVSAVSVPSKEVSATTVASGAVRVSWAGVSGADNYRIYHGTAAGAESRYVEIAASSTAYTYTGSAEKSGSPPTTGTPWVVKNNFELKNAQRVTVDGNVMENTWLAGQYGYAVVLTPRNSENRAPWSTVKDVTITNNIIRHAAGVFNIANRDDVYPSGPTTNVSVRNNLFYDIDNYTYGGGAKAILIGGGPTPVTFDHNTFVHVNSSFLYAYGPYTMNSFTFTNNLTRHFEYGIMGENTSPGNLTIQTFFPGSNITCNAIAGANPKVYPTKNAYPTVDAWTASFANFAGGDYRVVSTSAIYTPGCTDPIPGADVDKVNAAIGGASTPTPPPPSGNNVPPLANPGGPYNVAAGGSVTVNGSGSTDPDGSIASYRWAWGDDVLVRAADLGSSNIIGSAWVRSSMSDAAGGAALTNPDRGAPKIDPPSASPSSYVEFTVNAAAGVPYRLWIRMRAAGDYYGNDSLSVQFSGAVDASGNAVDRIGTTSAAAIVLEEGSGAGVSGWGWNDAAYGSVAPPVYFARSGPQTIRIQQREDGVSWDQFVLSAGAYRAVSPGALKNDTTILSAATGTGSGITAAHTYAVAGAYPLALTVVDNAGAAATALGVVNVGGASSTLSAIAGGPYSGSPGSAVAFNAGKSIVPSGSSPDYTWTFGDEIVLHASDVRTSDLHGRWAIVQDSTAADGVAIENADRGDAKIETPLASPANYVEFTFNAAAGVPYQLWLRMRAAGDSYTNDSLWVQFSGSITSSGTATNRIGTTSAMGVVLEEGSGAGESGWGWNDNGYGTLGVPVYFATSGPQTIRIQQREDGIRVDQIVLSAGRYLATSPGVFVQDRTIVPIVASDAHGAQVYHTYTRAATYPVTLTIKSTVGTAADTTSAVIR